MAIPDALKKKLPGGFRLTEGEFNIWHLRYGDTVVRIFSSQAADHEGVLEAAESHLRKVLERDQSWA